MASRRVKRLICVIAVLATMGSLAIAEQFEVGIGNNSANLYIEWKDSYAAEFTVRFDTPTVTGLGLFDIVEAGSSLTTVRQDFGWGVYIDGIAFNGHSNSGYGGDEDWWHYWVKNSGQPEWTSPAYGASERSVYNGDSDGWIYGRAGAVPEPCSIVMLGLGGFFLRRRRP